MLKAARSLALDRPAVDSELVSFAASEMPTGSVPERGHNIFSGAVGDRKLGGFFSGAEGSHKKSKGAINGAEGGGSSR